MRSPGRTWVFRNPTTSCQFGLSGISIGAEYKAEGARAATRRDAAVACNLPRSPLTARGPRSAAGVRAGWAHERAFRSGGRRMTPEQVTLVKQSFAQVAPIAPQAAALFYGRLFEIAPDVRPLFKRDMAEQGRMLMEVL